MQLHEGHLFDDRYRLMKLLGSGEFSEVWLVQDARVDDRQMALKVYAPVKGLDEDGVKLFSREFGFVFDFNHGNLLRPAHFDVCDRSPYLILPYCERGSAMKLIGEMAEEDVWRFLRDVSSALAYLHGQENPVIHQDIKPDNVLIDRNGNYLLTDFGISAKARGTLRRSMGDAKSGGAIAYMPPERFGKNNTPIKASDIWALGATLYELMEGDVPFLDILGGQAQANGAQIPEIEGNWSPELKRIVTLCLQKDTWDRPTAEQLLEWTAERFRGEKISFDNMAQPREDAGGDARPRDTVPRNNNGGDTTPRFNPEPAQPKSNKGKYILAAAVVIVLGILLFNYTRQPAQKLDELGELRRNAEQGDAVAQNKLGYRYQNGNGVPQSDTEAVNWYRKAAEQGNADAQNNLGTMYLDGNGVPQNVSEAVNWFRKSADQGNAWGQSNLGNMYRNGRGVSQSDTEAVNWYRKAADQGFAGAQNELGTMYRIGRGVPQNDNEAVNWFRKAAEQGDAYAQMNLGIMYLSGRGVAQNYNEGVNWFRKSADQGLAEGQYFLGRMYAEGFGVPQNYNEAVNWYRKAADQGNENAQKALDRLDNK